MSLSFLTAPLIGLAEAGYLPDSILRFGMRQLIADRSKSLPDCDDRSGFQKLLQELAALPVATETDRANEQHYEVRAEFFHSSLGKHLKYSCCYFEQDSDSLDVAEATSLRKTCEHALLADGQSVLELGCGWGSLSLWMAEHYPNSSITAISNSHSQKQWIDQQAANRGLKNLDVVTCDINELRPEEKFDRIVSVEMFEHVRNHRELMTRVSTWLKQNGRLFVHIFCHDRQPYLFEDQSETDWMTRHFFAGGIMPSRDLLIECQDSLVLENQVIWSGQHYEKTSNAWLRMMDSKPDQIAKSLEATYGNKWKMWRQRWRMFYMACAELFGFRGGQEWYVSHYLFRQADEILQDR
ncbi:MAG: cyclopropane-fatty-acyl-phospholipid synthase family protein [Fuerstiella sp.]